jgi:hypothetical protein
MKHTVHVTVTYSVEVDDAEIKAEFGKTNKKLVITQAMNNINPDAAFDASAKIFESYPEAKQKVRRGIGSY